MWRAELSLLQIWLALLDREISPFRNADWRANAMPFQLASLKIFDLRIEFFNMQGILRDSEMNRERTANHRIGSENGLFG